MIILTNREYPLSLNKAEPKFKRKFHDMEEIIGLRSWLIKNESILAKRFPK